MKVGLVTIGNELLSGFTVDTNSSWIGQSLIESGARISWHLTVKDDFDQIKIALDSVPKYCKALLITGGLGPTHDDITQETIFEYYGIKPVFDEEYWKLLTSKMKLRGKTLPNINKNQAIVPEPGKGNVIPNKIGSARGIHIFNNDIDVFVMPGVPKEMKNMMKHTVLPWIYNKTNSKIYVNTIRTTGIMESSLAEKVGDIIQSSENTEIAFLPQFTGVDIRIISSDRVNMEKAQKSINKRVGKKYIYGTDSDSLENVVGQMLLERNLTLSTAESCTGGLLGHRLTNTPGSSSYYLGGVNSYSNEMKINVINVKKTTLDKYGAVSKEVSIEMSRGVRDLLKSDLALSITGVAGPGGGTKKKPVGLVYITLIHNKVLKTKEFIFFKDRLINKKLSSQVALNMIRNHLLNG